MRKKTLSLHNETLTLNDPTGNVLAKRTIGEPAPPPPRHWMRPLRPLARLSRDGAYVWHLGYRDKRPMITLLSGETLEVLGTHAPQTLPYPPVPPYYNEGDEPLPLEHWGEDFSLRISGDPSTAILFANAGDSGFLLHALVATPEGISNPAGMSLVERVMISLDGRIFDAAMVARDGLLMLGDADDLHFVSWPEGVKQRAISVPVPEGGECVELAVQGDLVKVYYAADDGMGHVRLNARTLEPYVAAAETKLQALAERLQDEVGLVAHCFPVDKQPTIQGGGGYHEDEILGFALYEHKFEVRFKSGQYHLKMPHPTPNLVVRCDTPNDALRTLFAHFQQHYPEIALQAPRTVTST